MTGTRAAVTALLLLAKLPLAVGVELKWCTVAGRESGGQLEKEKCDLMATIVNQQQPMLGQHTLVCVSRDDCHSTALEVCACLTHPLHPPSSRVNVGTKRVEEEAAAMVLTRAFTAPPSLWGTG